MQVIEKALKLPGSIVDTAAYVLQRRVADIREKERHDEEGELGSLINPADL